MKEIRHSSRSSWLANEKYMRKKFPNRSCSISLMISEFRAISLTLNILARQSMPSMFS